MDVLLRPLFNVLTVPDLKIKKPAWIQMPSPWTIFTFVLLSYFLVTGGIIYDVIVEPPSVGSTTDEHGHTRPVAFMPYRVNGQYIMEGLASSFMFRLTMIISGLFSRQTLFQPGWSWDDHPGPDSQPQHTEAEQDHAAVRGIRRHGHQFRLLLGLYEDEAARLHAVLSPGTAGISLYHVSSVHFLCDQF